VVQLLKKAGVSFGVIGSEESCCGESVRKIGDEELFQKLAQGNISLFQDKGVRKIITTSPHCLYTFRQEYPELGGEFEVVHHSRLLAQLVREGKLKPKDSFGKKVVYHDPCYLGRHNEIYEDPREVLSAAAGDDFTEMRRTRENSLCCGGGGGRVWMETAPGERFGDLRIEEALAKNAQVLATSCPYCIVMLDASAKTMGKEQDLAIKDIAEILLETVD
jgi:Fe-S oxidoreductase